MNKEYNELFELYHESTKNRKLWPAKLCSQSEEEELVHHILKGGKTYRFSESISLPKVYHNSIAVSFGNVIRRRRSTRQFSNKSVSLGKLSQLLSLSYGVTGSLEFVLGNGKIRNYPLRAVPSGGALYPIEIYLVNLNVKGIKKGIYHFTPLKHKLELINEGDYRQKITNCYTPAIRPSHQAVTSAAVIILLSAVFPRTKFKYGNLAYRIILLDAGHLGENIYLSATALGLGAVGLLSFYDDELHKLLRIDGVDEAVVYSLAVGKKLNNLNSKYSSRPNFSRQRNL